MLGQFTASGLQDHELSAYLGGTPATDGQRHAMLAASDRIATRWPAPDMCDVRETAFTAAIQVILGEATLEQVAGHWASVRSLERTAHAEMTGALIASAGTEQALADRAGVTRMTVRKALGKG